MTQSECKDCGFIHNLKSCFARCSKCGGERDSEGWCPNYCTDFPYSTKEIENGQAVSAMIIAREFGIHPTLLKV